MRIFEEYFKRHGINDVPVAHHCAAGAVILRTLDRSVWSNRWILATFKWEHHDHHPGSYIVDLSSPVHDGYQKGSIFAKWPPTKMKWDQYEDFFLDWVNGLKGVQAVKGGREALMACWEMFVYAYDSWFLKQSFDTKGDLYRSLDKDNSLDARYVSYQDVAIYLSTHHPAVLRTWKYEVLSQVQCYSDWLVKLVEERCKTQERMPPSKLEIL